MNWSSFPGFNSAQSSDLQPAHKHQRSRAEECFLNSSQLLLFTSDDLERVHIKSDDNVPLFERVVRLGQR